MGCGARLTPTMKRPGAGQGSWRKANPPGSEERRTVPFRSLVGGTYEQDRRTQSGRTRQHRPAEARAGFLILGGGRGGRGPERACPSVSMCRCLPRSWGQPLRRGRVAGRALRISEKLCLRAGDAHSPPRGCAYVSTFEDRLLVDGTSTRVSPQIPSAPRRASRGQCEARPVPSRATSSRGAGRSSVDTLCFGSRPGLLMPAERGQQQSCPPGRGGPQVSKQCSLGALGAGRTARRTLRSQGP